LEYVLKDYLENKKRYINYLFEHETWKLNHPGASDKRDSESN
jgi:hypothetical protein